MWPNLPIGAGILLLAFNFGWFSFGALWSLLNLWPVVLIAVGNDVITSGRAVFDLREATLTALSYGAGVGETIVTLSERGGYRAEFELGVGAATVQRVR